MIEVPGTTPLGERRSAIAKRDGAHELMSGPVFGREIDGRAMRKQRTTYYEHMGVPAR